MKGKVKSIKLLYLLLLLFASINTLYSQTGKAKSLEIGNKWVYVQDSNNTSRHEVIGDTTIENRQYAIISVKYDSLSFLDEYLFERADSSKIYRYYPTYMSEFVQVDFAKPDSVSYYYTIHNDTIYFWNSWRARQTIYQRLGMMEGMSIYIEGIGFQYGFSSGGMNLSSTTLIAGLIEGEIFGDTTEIMIVILEENKQISFTLSQNYPNPFNPNTTIKYSIKERGFVQLKVYDILGKEVTTLVNEEKQQGNYSVSFNGNNLPSGVYVYSLRVNDFIQNNKMTLLK